MARQQANNFLKCLFPEFGSIRTMLCWDIFPRLTRQSDFLAHFHLLKQPQFSSPLLPYWKTVLHLQCRWILLFQQISSGGWTSSVQHIHYNKGNAINREYCTCNLQNMTCPLRFALQINKKHCRSLNTPEAHDTTNITCKSQLWCCCNNCSYCHVHNGQLICIGKICEIDWFIFISDIKVTFK